MKARSPISEVNIYVSKLDMARIENSFKKACCLKSEHILCITGLAMGRYSMAADLDD